MHVRVVDLISAAFVTAMRAAGIAIVPMTYNLNADCGVVFMELLFSIAVRFHQMFYGHRRTSGGVGKYEYCTICI